MADSDKEQKQKERLDKLDRLADLIIDDLVKIAESGELSSADRKLILDFLRQNGLNLDPTSIPQAIGDMLTSRVKFDAPDDDVLPIRRHG